MSSSQHRRPSPQPERIYRQRSTYDRQQNRLFYLQALNQQRAASANVFRNPGGRPTGSTTAIWDDSLGPVTRALPTNPSAFALSQGTDVVITVSQDQRREFVKMLPEAASKKKKKKRRIHHTVSPADGDGWDPVPEDFAAIQEEDDEDDDAAGAVSILMEGSTACGDEDTFSGTGKRKRYASSVCSYSISRRTNHLTPI